MSWEISYYISPSGRPVVQEFIDDLPKPTRAKVFRQLDVLELKGADLGMPNSKPLGDGLVELRVRSGRGTNEVRIFYIFAKTLLNVDVFTIFMFLCSLRTSKSLSSVTR